ncbi:hypothetical protein Bca4012_036254 [Brassica carinata]
MTSQLLRSRSVRKWTSIHPQIVFTKRAIPGVTPRLDRRNLQEIQLSYFLCQVQLLPRRHTYPTAPLTNPKIYRPRRASAYKRERSRRTAIPKTSSSTPKSSQDSATRRPYSQWRPFIAQI